MVNCGSCRHWTALTSTSERPIGQYRDKDRPEVVAATALYGHCGAMAEGPIDADTQPIQTPIAIVADYDNVGANLFTRAEFGCVLGEKPSTPSLEEEMIGRREFDRFRRDHTVAYDWADMGDAEKQRWIDRGQQRETKA